jgi:dephospho-CoA kinase
MIRVGLTGGIGSGKSTVAAIFQVLGIPVYYADEETKKLMNEDPRLRTEITRHFGDKAYSNKGLDRAFLATVVFNNREKLDLLNSLTHPITIQHAADWMKKQTTPYVIKEAALIFESGSAENLDYIIGVSAPFELRIQRVMKRDRTTRAEIEKRMSRQLDEKIKMMLCDTVINNNEKELVIPQVLSIHEKLSRGLV